MKDLKWKMRRADSYNSSLGMSKSSNFRSVKIIDSLSKDRKTLNNKSCLNELESIVNSL
jgi:hypothetical protein